MKLVDMYKYRIKVTKGKLWKWYIVIGTGILLMFLSACAGQPDRKYYYEEKCNPDYQIQYCEGRSPHSLKCVCIARRDLG